MTTITSKDAQNKFGQLIESAQREPVSITRRDRRVAVVVSGERYDQLEALEDAVWAARAREAAKTGFASPEESMGFIQRMLNADTETV